MLFVGIFCFLGLCIYAGIWIWHMLPYILAAVSAIWLLVFIVGHAVLIGSIVAVIVALVVAVVVCDIKGERDAQNEVDDLNYAQRFSHLALSPDVWTSRFRHYERDRGLPTAGFDGNGNAIKYPGYEFLPPIDEPIPNSTPYRTHYEYYEHRNYDNRHDLLSSPSNRAYWTPTFRHYERDHGLPSGFDTPLCLDDLDHGKFVAASELVSRVLDTHHR